MEVINKSYTIVCIAEMPLASDKKLVPLTQDSDSL